MKYDYFDFGERIEVEAPGGVTTYSYDTLGQLREKIDFKGFISRYGYDALNRLDVMTHRRGLQADGALLSSYDYRVRADGKRKGYDETVAND